MNKTLQKLAQQEQDFLKTQFLSPVLKNQPIAVRIADIICRFSIKPKNFEGWGVFRPTSFSTATSVRKANKIERSEYLKLFPVFRFALAYQHNDIWYGCLACDDDRLNISGFVPIRLTEEVQRFQTVTARYDGNTFWFDRIMNSSLRVSTELRTALADLTKPKELTIRGLTKVEYYLYHEIYNYELAKQQKSKEDLMKEALSRGGASYISHVERGATYSVEYRVDGKVHTSNINKETLRQQRLMKN
jgi:hypothetical protein